MLPPPPKKEEPKSTAPMINVLANTSNYNPAEGETIHAVDEEGEDGEDPLAGTGASTTDPAA